MKMYSCIESASDTCPDSLSFVKQNRPDRPNFCIASNYTTLVGFKKYSTNPRKFQICSDDCKLCNAYSSSHSLCNICDTSNKKYNFPQAGPFQWENCESNSIGDKCTARNLTNSCLSCSNSTDSIGLVWVDSFNKGCDCAVGYIKNSTTSTCDKCPDYCKYNF